MTAIIILLVVFAVLIGFAKYKGNWFIMVPGTFFIGLISLATAFVATVRHDSSNCNYTTTTTPIVSIERSQQTSGSFFLGTGNVNSTAYYFAYVNEKDGLLLTRYRTDETFIVEGSGPPRVKSYDEHCYQWLKSFLLNDRYYYTKHNVKHQIYVPKNTILKEFKL